MLKNITFSMIKPDGVENGQIGSIISKIDSAGFNIIALKMTQLSRKRAESFYSIHRQRPFFQDLINFITRGPIVAMVLEKVDAVNDFRTLIGSTDPNEAADGTIRKLYATSKGENVIHGSDSDENAQIECFFHFSNCELFNEK
ncbi:MAG: nucleoside-diphosphate kinase [Flavobacteriaceae bacterium]|jgi:nucleoside-diphosphate kinase|nr:nucleoside-diphosphate kinase [Flavobacteriaceae bacterium]|tara:strand:- start:421 stop:849 length:429 start_codon:yes stop_codon:yes gene_type:complete